MGYGLPLYVGPPKGVPYPEKLKNSLILKAFRNDCNDYGIITYDYSSRFCGRTVVPKLG